MRSRTVFTLSATATAAAFVSLALLSSGYGQNPRLERVSVSSTGVGANAASVWAALSADGRYVAFASDATNLAGGAQGRNVFVHDRLTGATELASSSSGGTPGNGQSTFPAISGDGRYVVFQSDADNLVSGDTNHATDVFLHDRMNGNTTRVSVAGDGTPGNGDSMTPSISANGRYVTFTSLADNLIAGDGNKDRDVFVRDLVAGTTELVSLASNGTQGNNASGGLGAGPARISNDGRYVVFGSFANNLVANDTNNADDVFLRDRMSGTTERVSIGSAGEEGNNHSMFGSVSDDGRYVAFFSGADNLTPNDSNHASDVFLRDRVTGVTTLLSVGPGGVPADGASSFPAISADGSSIAYQSDASNLVLGDSQGHTEAFLYHVSGEFNERLTVPSGDGEPDGASSFVAISADGGAVAFQSDASNLVAGDANGATDIFAWGKSFASPTSTPTPLPPTVMPTPTSAPRIGDVNGDGRVDSIDAAIILQYAAGFLPSPPGGSLSDVNHDGRTNAIDAALILQFSAGLLSQFPPP